MPLHAQTTNLEMVAMFGGRIIGAAKACGINAERIRRTSGRLRNLIDQKATSGQERESASRLLASSQAAGTEEVRSERSRCSGVHVDFSEIEIKLDSRPGGSSNDPVVAKRGVPPIGVLQPGSIKR